jgi:hypothetical protein
MKPGGIVQRGLSDGRAKMDSRDVKVLFVTLVASMADLTRAMQISALELAP